MTTLAKTLTAQIGVINRALEEIAGLVREADVGEFDLSYDSKTTDRFLVKGAFSDLDAALASFFGTVQSGKATSFISDPDDAEASLAMRFEENREESLGPYVDPNAEHRLSAAQLGVGGR